MEELKRNADSPMLAIEGLTPPESVQPIEGGSVTSPAGFRACGVHAGFRPDPERLDFALVVADEPVNVAAVFTQNVFCAAPVQYCRERLDTGVEHRSYGSARAIAVNSGNANAATGAVGRARAAEMAAMVAEAVGCADEDVLVCSTGVIGVQLDLAPLDDGLPRALEALSTAGGPDAARAIITTDTYPKTCACRVEAADLRFEGATFTIGAMTKGSGMIMPNMATMIAVITTDAPIAAPDLHQMLVSAVATSFNKVTVDSDTSTNDTCIALASGLAAPGQTIEPGSADYERLQSALTWVCQTLARQMAADGEGATRLLTVRVVGAADDADADRAARAVANSPLVKTAVYGHDANWGRIAAALGKSGAHFHQEDVDIAIMGIPVCRQGLALAFDEDEALARFERPEIAIDVDLGCGDASATVWSCDFSHEYVRINGDYRS